MTKQPEPSNLKALKEDITLRWGTIDLLDVLKEVDHATRFTSEFTSVASRTITDPDVLRRRLLLCLWVGHQRRHQTGRRRDRRGSNRNPGRR